jgi:hypothetical protein
VVFYVHPESLALRNNRTVSESKGPAARKTSDTVTKAALGYDLELKLAERKKLESPKLKAKVICVFFSTCGRCNISVQVSVCMA